MTLNITKKKIEKVLELFNHPQTRKIRKNRGKKRRRNNKSFNRKNGRKNLATSTLKKRGGHPLSNGGQVGVVLGGGPVAKKMMKNTSDKLKTFISNISKLSTEAKTQLKNAISKAGNNIKEKKEALINYIKRKKDISKDINDDEIRNIDDEIRNIDDEQIQKIIDEIMIRLDEKEISTDQKKQETKKETKKEVTKSKEIDTSDMLKVALASNYFTQYGILSGMLKMNQEKDNNKFDVMNFVQDPKLYAEFCNKMGFQFAKTSEKVNEVPVVDNKAIKENQDEKIDAISDAYQDENIDAKLDTNSDVQDKISEKDERIENTNIYNTEIYYKLKTLINEENRQKEEEILKKDEINQNEYELLSETGKDLYQKVEINKNNKNTIENINVYKKKDILKQEEKIQEQKQKEEEKKLRYNVLNQTQYDELKETEKNKYLQFNSNLQIGNEIKEKPYYILNDLANSYGITTDSKNVDLEMKPV